MLSEEEQSTWKLQEMSSVIGKLQIPGIRVASVSPRQEAIQSYLPLARYSVTLGMPSSLTKHSDAYLLTAACAFTICTTQKQWCVTRQNATSPEVISTEFFKEF